MSEHDEQSALFLWARDFEGKVPELSLLFAIPNGGHRMKAVAGKMRAEGVRAGVPDVFLPVQRYDPTEHEMMGGLFIEMKYGKNRVEPTQQWWHERLRQRSYKVAVCYSWLEAQRAICDYLGVPELVLEK